jgi:hypothetical protein
MACERKALPADLRFVPSKNTKLGFSLRTKSGPVKLKVRSIPVNTGSGANVHKLEIITPNKKTYHAVSKMHFSSNERKLRGLQHEREVYEFLNHLVNEKICPFFLRSYVIIPNSPDTERDMNHVLITESFPSGRFTTMNRFLKSRPSKLRTPTDAIIFLLMLLYTIEIMYRVGLRHNDMHLNNIFIIQCPKTTFEIKYVTRDNRSFNFFLHDVKYMPLFFDNDRATKLSPLPGVKFRHAHRFAPKNHTAVTARFHWHNPQHRTEKLNMYKLMQHVRNTVISASPVYRIIRNTCYNSTKRRHCLSEGSALQSRIAKKVQESAFRNYHLPLDKKNANGTEIIPHWSGTSERFLFELIKQLPRQNRATHVMTINMGKLYDDI